ncbi:MAG TPA: BON domain-containing protein [Caulobacteraceae bacterium]
MAEHDKWGDRDRQWREDRSWNDRGRSRYASERGGEGRYSTEGEGRWRQAQRDRREEGPAGYNPGGSTQGGWEFGDEEQGGYRRGQGQTDRSRFEAQRYGEPGRGYYDEFGRDPAAGAGYGETWNRDREYGRGGGAGAGSQTGQYAGQGGYGISAQGEYGGYSTGRSGQSRYAYGAHTPYGYRGRNEYDERGRGGEYADEPEGRSWLERAGEKVSAFFGAEGEGQHRGRGPKGYRRSDDRIREDVSDRLTDDPWLDASSIEVEVNECEVVLKGAVNSREDKRRAEHLSEAISGVRNVQNHLRVEDGRSAATSTYSGEQATNTTSSARSGQTSTANRDQKGGRLQAPDSAPGLNT